MVKKKKVHDVQKQLLLEKEPPKSGILHLLAEIVIGISFSLGVFTVFLTLKLSNVVDWQYWWICSPLWALLFALLIVTQSKRLTNHFPLIARVVWLICLLALVIFLVLMCIYLERRFANFTLLFLPLWVLNGSCLLLGISGVFIALCVTADEVKKRNYLLAGVSMLGFDAIFFPFFLLVQLKLTYFVTAEWSIIFIPLWVTDGFFLLLGFVLLLFTLGARDSAIFSLSQLIAFIFVIPVAALFKVLLILVMDGTLRIAYFMIMLPLVGVELLVMSCGINIRLTKRLESVETVV